jgi:aspartyl-tRNA(Asn)/glutamyl-tRNA(Gln) amidotransferase subunit A
MARSVEDCALMLNVLAGYDHADPASARVPAEDYTAALGSPVKGLKIGVLRSWYADGADAEVMTAVDSALTVLTGMGAVVEDVAIPSIELAKVSPAIMMSEAFSYHEADLRENPEKFNPLLSNRLKTGGLFLGYEYVNAQRARQVLKTEVTALLKEVDVLLTPTTAKTATPFETAYVEMSRRGPSYTSLFNMTGLPALSIPCGFDSAGLPIGLQIAGRPFAEKTVLQLGHAYERAAGWYTRHPAI